MTASTGDMPPVTLTWHGPVAIVRLNDPATRNSLTFDLVDTLRVVLDEIEERARVMILCGAGGHFCSGANLNGGFVRDRGDPLLADCGEPLETHMNPLMSRLRGFRIPWISAVSGYAAGAGASLALAADMVIASANARFVQAFAKIGLVPDAGAFHLLVRTIGRVRANELMLLGGTITADEAHAWGLVNRVIADGDVEDAALALAQRIAAGPASLGMIRRLTWEALDRDFHGMIWAEREAQLAAGRSADFREGVTAFREKREPRFGESL